MMVMVTRIIVAAMVVAINAAAPIGIMECLIPDVADLCQRRFCIYFLFFTHASGPL